MKKTVVQYVALLALMAITLVAALPFARAADVIPETSVVAAADTELPSDVENVQATAGDSQVTLSWNVATDNEMVAGYSIYYGTIPVTEAGQEYEFDPVDVGNKITYDMAGLENGTTYYFAVIAYDSSENESENYSVEVSATPLHGASNEEAPKVVSAEAQDKFTVLVTFSEAVNLPVEPQNSFMVKEDGSGISLNVLGASMDLNDSTNTTVVLTTETQKAGQTYIVTAGIEVTDLEDNPIESGTSDTGVFTGTDLEAPVEDSSDTDTTGPELVDVTAPDSTSVLVNFSEAILLSPEPTQNFVITQESDSQKTLAVNEAILSNDGMSVALTTDPQEGIDYFIIVLDVSDSAGNLMDVANNAAAFTGHVTEEPVEEEPVEEEPVEEEPVEEEPVDVDPPEDATEFVAKMVSSMMVQLSWSPSLNSAGDLMSYVLYKSLDGANYAEGMKLDSTVSSHDLSDLASDTAYYYKLAAQDSAGNESVGVETSFILPATGPELILLFAGSLGMGRLMTRKKKRKVIRK